MALAIDASTPAAAQSANGVSVTTLVSSSFSPPAGSTILVFWGNGNTGTNPTAVTDSLGGHLSWSTDLTAGSAANGSSGMFWANCPSAQAGMTVTLTFASTQALYIMPVVFTGAAVSPIGLTNTTDLPASVPTLTVTPTGTGSYVFGVVENGFGTASPTVPGGQTITVNGHNTFLSEATHVTSSWVQFATAQSTAGTPVTINDTAPTGVSGGMAVVEILAAVPSFQPHRMPLGM